MDIYCISHNRADIISSHLFFDLAKHNFNLVVRTEEEKEKYLQNETLKNVIFHVSNADPGNVPAHDWKWKNLVPEGRWVLCMDDNILGFQSAKEPFYSKGLGADTPREYEDISGEDFILKIEDSIKYADSIGSNIVGTAVVDNPFFRKVKYKKVGFIQHKCFAIKKTPKVNYDLNVKIREEYDMTGQQLLHHGFALRNEYLWCKRKHFMKGGIGSYDQRLPGYLHDTRYLMKKYPGLFRVNSKKDVPEGAEIVVRLTDLNQVEKWRMMMRRNSV